MSEIKKIENAISHLKWCKENSKATALGDLYLKILEEKLEREQGRNKNCDSCIHANEMWNLEPCVSCKAIQMTNWEGAK